MEKETKQPTYKTQPLSTIELKLQEKFAEEIANQGALMDSMGKQLLSLELAMVGIYATVLKLIAGEGATMQGGVAVGITFLLWFMAVVATVLAIFPEKYEVNIGKMDEIKRYFHNSAQKKAKMLMASVALFFGGVGVSVFTVI
jgi:hypothetical protein